MGSYPHAFIMFSMFLIYIEYHTEDIYVWTFFNIFYYIWFILIINMMMNENKSTTFAFLIIIIDLKLYKYILKYWSKMASMQFFGCLTLVRYDLRLISASPFQSIFIYKVYMLWLWCICLTYELGCNTHFLLNIFFLFKKKNVFGFLFYFRVFFRFFSSQSIEWGCRTLLRTIMKKKKYYIGKVNHQSMMNWA